MVNLIFAMLFLVTSVDLGPDKVVKVGEVPIHGDIKTDNHGVKPGFRWILLAAPNKQAYILGAKSLDPVLHAPTEGEYVIMLVVGDGTDQPLVSDTVVLTAKKNIL